MIRNFYLRTMDCDICGFRANATLFQKNVYLLFIFFEVLCDLEDCMNMSEKFKTLSVYELNLLNMLDIDFSDLIYIKVETKSIEFQTDCTLMDMKRIDLITDAYPFSVDEKRNIGKMVLNRITKWVMSLKVFDQLNKECRLGLFVNCWEQLFMLNMYAWPKEENSIDFNENFRLLRLKLQGHNFNL